MMSRASAIAVWILVLVATAASAVFAWWWSAIDGAVIERADLAGWNGFEMLPAQELIWFAVNTQFLVLLAASVLTTVLAMRTLRPRNLSAPRTAPPAGSPR